jgi:tetratricopeptide (TPR) repeat protein
MKLLLIFCTLAWVHLWSCDEKAAMVSYENKEFQKAQLGFEECVDKNPHSAWNHYNLGNAYYRQGRNGFAVFHWEFALSLDPSLDDAIYNLKIIRKQLFPENEISPATEFMFKIYHSISLNSGLWLFWFLGFLVAIGVYLSQKYPKQKSLFYICIAFFVLLMLPLGIVSGYKIYQKEFLEKAIVLTPDLGVFSGPSESNQRIAVIQEALVLEIIMNDKNWVSVKVNEDLIGFVKAKDIKVLP